MVDTNVVPPIPPVDDDDGSTENDDASPMGGSIPHAIAPLASLAVFFALIAALDALAKVAPSAALVLALGLGLGGWVLPLWLLRRAGY